MPIRKTEIVDSVGLSNTIEQFGFGDTTAFITISLKPYLYKESFKNQFTTTQKELKQFLKCIMVDKCIVTTEATKQNNVHYHVVANVEHAPAIIDDFVKNFKRLGNTKTTIRQHNQTIGEMRNNINGYVTKDFDRTDNLLNGLYKDDYTAPAYLLERLPDKVKPTKHILATLIKPDKEFVDDMPEPVQTKYNKKFDDAKTKNYLFGFHKKIDHDINLSNN